MGFIKNIARKILSDEIEDYKNKISDLNFDKDSLQRKISSEKLKYSEDLLKEVQETARLKKRTNF